MWRSVRPCLEVDGTAYLHGSLIFDNSNGESDLLVLDNNPTARPNITVPLHLKLRRIWSLRPWEVSNQCPLYLSSILDISRMLTFSSPENTTVPSHLIMSRVLSPSLKAILPWSTRLKPLV